MHAWDDNDNDNDNASCPFLLSPSLAPALPIPFNASGVSPFPPFIQNPSLIHPPFADGKIIQ